MHQDLQKLSSDSNLQTRLSTKDVELQTNENPKDSSATGPDERTPYSDTISQKEQDIKNHYISAGLFVYKTAAWSAMSQYGKSQKTLDLFQVVFLWLIHLYQGRLWSPSLRH